MVHVKNQPNTVLDVTTSDVLSSSGTGIVTTNYFDDYIVKGNSFSNETVRTVTAGTEYFVLDPTNCTCNQIFKLPIIISMPTGTATVALYEGTDYSGTESLNLVNRNRNSSNVAKTTLKAGGTGTELGTEILKAIFGTDTSFFFNAGGGAGSSANAFILDKTKKYLFEIVYSDSTTVGYNMEIIEV